VFFFAIDHIEGVKKSLHAGICAPQRDRDSENQGKTQLASRLRGQAGKLVAYDFGRSARQYTGQIVEMLANARRVGKEAVDRNKGRNAWKDGQENEESHTGRNRDDPVLRYIVVDAPKDVLPAPERNVRGRGCAPSPPVLTFS
jgi:hypothetical protein